MNLYEITKEEERLTELFELVETEDDNNAVIELLEEIQKQITNKGSNIIKARKRTETTIESIKSEISRLNEYKKYLENRQEKFNNYVIECMKRLDVKRIETPLGVISLRNTPGKIVIDNPDLISNEYIIQKITFEVSKSKIKTAISNGKVIEGVHIEKGTTLTIK